MVLLRPCATAAAYEAVPPAELRLDVAAVRDRMVAHGWRLLADAGLMIVLDKDGLSASVFQSGKVMIKTRDPAVAERVWQDVARHIPEVAPPGA